MKTDIRAGLASGLLMACLALAGCNGGGSSDAEAAPVPDEDPVNVGETPPAPNIVHPDIVDEVRAEGRIVNPGIAELYKPKQNIGPLEGVQKIGNIHYGPDERQFVDVFTQQTRSTDELAPVVVFVHGGAYIGGAVTTPGSFPYDNIGKYFVRNGLVFVNVEYRLAPDHKWPTGGQDVSSAIAWAHSNISQYGGDPNKMFVMGHSAGATHAAHYAFDTRVQANGGDDGVVGAILLSPQVSEETLGNNKTYFPTPFTPDMAPLNHINERDLPVFLGVAQYDSMNFQNDVAKLYSALCQRDDQCPAIKTAQQHNHMTSVYHINTEDDTYGSDLLTFIRDVTTRPAAE